MTNFADTIVQVGMSGNKPILKPNPTPADASGTVLSIQNGVCVDYSGTIHLYSELTSSVSFAFTFGSLPYNWPVLGNEGILVGNKNDSHAPPDGAPWPWGAGPISTISELDFTVPVEDNHSARRYRMIYIDPQNSGKHDIEPGIQNH